jgi:hypothetical protein
MTTLPSMSTRKAAAGLLVLVAASLLLLASPAAAARRLKQEDAPLGEPVTASLGTTWCISLKSTAPGPITLQTHEWIVSGRAARPDSCRLLAEQRNATAPGPALP